MKYNGYQLVHQVLEMSLGQTLSRGTKHIAKTIIKKDPYVGSFIAIPGIPFHHEIGVPLHFARFPGSRKVAKAMVRKIWRSAKDQAKKLFSK